MVRFISHSRSLNSPSLDWRFVPRKLKSKIQINQLFIDLFAKMMVDDVGDVTITNDGATILQLLEVSLIISSWPFESCKQFQMKAQFSGADPVEINSLI